MRRAYKYKLLPTTQQAILINKTVGCARLIYNSLLNDYKTQLDNGLKPKLKEVTHFKNTFTFLNEVDSLALANAKQHLQTAFKNYFDSKKGKRKGKKVRFPKKHKKSKCKLSYTTNNQNGTIRLENGKLKLPKLGFVDIVLHRELVGNITSCTIEQTRDGQYYASIAVEIPDKNVDYTHKRKKYNELKIVGIDMSLTDFSVDSDSNPDDTKAKYIRNYRRNEKRLKRLQRMVSRKVKGSSNRYKSRKRLSKLSRHVANCRLDYCHKLSRYYVDKYDVIVLEDINLQDMSRTLHLGKSVMDLGFGEFRSFLEYKCIECDSCVMYVDKWFPSSKTCHECGSKNDLLQLSDREWVCPTCGCVIDRDYNAALNLRDYFYHVVLENEYNTAGTAGINAPGEVTSTLRETLMQAASLNGEAPSFRWG